MIFAFSRLWLFPWLILLVELSFSGSVWVEYGHVFHLCFLHLLQNITAVSSGVSKNIDLKQSNPQALKWNLIFVLFRSGTGRTGCSLNSNPVFLWWMKWRICQLDVPSLLLFTITVLDFCAWRVRHIEVIHWHVLLNKQLTDVTSLIVDVCMKDAMSAADSLYNLQLILEFCDSCLKNCCPLVLEDLLYSPAELKVLQQQYMLKNFQIFQIFKCWCDLWPFRCILIL